MNGYRIEIDERECTAVVDDAVQLLGSKDDDGDAGNGIEETCDGTKEKQQIAVLFTKKIMQF